MVRITQRRASRDGRQHERVVAVFSAALRITIRKAVSSALHASSETARCRRTPASYRAARLRGSSRWSRDLGGPSSTTRNPIFFEDGTAPDSAIGRLRLKIFKPTDERPRRAARVDAELERARHERKRSVDQPEPSQGGPNARRRMPARQCRSMRQRERLRQLGVDFYAPVGGPLVRLSLSLNRPIALSERVPSSKIWDSASSTSGLRDRADQRRRSPHLAARYELEWPKRAVSLDGHEGAARNRLADVMAAPPERRLQRFV